MRSNYLAIQLLLILISGLISCSPDKNTASPDTTKETNLSPVFRNSDGTYRKIKGTDTTSVESFLELGLTAQEVQDMLAVSVSECKTNFLSNPVRIEKTFTRTNNIPIIDTLPIEVFTPISEKEKQVVCQYNIKIYLDETFVGDILFNNLNLKDTDSFTNLELPFLNERDDKYFMRDHLNQRSLNLSTEQAEIQSLCETSSKYSFSNSNTISISELFDNSLFYDQNTINCRFAARDMKTQKLWLSPDFYIQNKKPKFKVINFTTHMQAEPSLELWNQLIAQLTLRNDSPSPLRFQWSHSPANISARSIYSTLGNGLKPHIGNHFNMSALWTIQNLSELSVIKVEDQSFYELPPYGELVIDLISQNTNLTCTSYYNAPDHQPLFNGNCQTQILFEGISYNIDQFPVIEFNQSTSLQSIATSSFYALPELGPRTHDHLNHWAPSELSTSLCTKGRKPIANLTGPSTELQFKNISVFKCAVN